MIILFGLFTVLLSILQVMLCVLCLMRRGANQRTFQFSMEAVIALLLFGGCLLMPAQRTLEWSQLVSATFVASQIWAGYAWLRVGLAAGFRAYDLLLLLPVLGLAWAVYSAAM